MADLYVDATGSGSNTSPYDTPAKATANLQTAINACSAGDTIWCYGTQTLTSGGTDEISIDAPGTVATGTPSNPIKIVGVNSSWVEDGTRFVLDGADTNGNDGIAIVDGDYYEFRNIRCTRMSLDGFEVAGLGATAIFFINCESDNNGGIGFNTPSASNGCIFFRCAAHHNGTYGWFRPQGAPLLFCVISYNGAGGVSEFGLVYGCLIVNNLNYGLYYPDNNSSAVINCVIHGNSGDGIAGAGASYQPFPIIGCRITDNGDGVNEYSYDLGGTARGFMAFTFTRGGNSGEINGEVYAHECLIGQGVNGYFNEGAEDYSLTPQASLYSTEVTLPTVSAEPT